MLHIIHASIIIIWDERTMAHMHSLEVLDRTLKYLNNNVRLLSGETLPIISRAIYTDEINARLK